MMKTLLAISVGWVACVHAVAAEPTSSTITPSFVQMAQQSFVNNYQKMPHVFVIFVNPMYCCETQVMILYYL